MSPGTMRRHHHHHHQEDSHNHDPDQHHHHNNHHHHHHNFTMRNCITIFVLLFASFLPSCQAQGFPILEETAYEQRIVLGMFRLPYEKTKPTFEMRPIEPADTLLLARSIPQRSVFSPFFRSHRLAAKELCDYLMEARNVSELRELVEGVQHTVNEKLFIYSLSSVILRKPEMRKFHLPSIIEIFPSNFVPRPKLAELEQQARQLTHEDVIITEYGQEFSGTHKNPEHRVAYWREDYGINSHHWHWHLVFPMDQGVDIDRKGEVFYYMHQQMVARYDMDRLSVDLNRVQKLSNWRIPIPDGYFSKLTLDNSGQVWGSRQDNTVLQECRRGKFMEEPLDVSDLEQQRNRIMDAIHQGHLIDREGNRVRLTDEGVEPSKRGIVLLGDAVEADANRSLNSPFYGEIHNLGHIIISAAHDPDNVHKENLGVMSDTTTAVRDPVFFRWHKYIDSVFQEYKLMQTPYTLQQLSLDSVRVTEVRTVCAGRTNILYTGWNTRDFEANHGLDFNSPVPVKVRLTHLDHLPFMYDLQVENTERTPKKVTIRIFMAPKLNERGVSMDFMEQRLLWAEMDRFKYTLKPGPNNVTRESTASSITNPNEWTFRDIANLTEFSNPADPENDLSNYCRCGWPQHMLLPRGKQEGMDFELFVMVTDWAQDKVRQPAGRRSCANATSFCGVLDGLYPDARPMGFPFDRRPMPKLNGQTLERAANLTRLSNIAVQDIKIFFTNMQLKLPMDHEMYYMLRKYH